MKSILLFAGIILSTNLFAQQSGVLDSTFDGDGKMMEQWGGLSKIILQADGKIVSVGGSGYCLARYNVDGTVDSTFNYTGKVLTSFGPYVPYANTAIIQPDGKIIAGGYCDMGIAYDYSMARYNTDGSLDSTFDSDGKVITAIYGGQGSEMITCMVLQPDGKIIVTGWLEYGLVRYDSTGTLDSSYGINGKVYDDILDVGETNDILIQPDGKIVSAGWASYLYDNPVFGIARHHTDGSLDSTFNGTGLVSTYSIGKFGIGNAAVLQPDGKILVSGQGEVDGTYLIMRFNTDGTVDSSYGINGAVVDTVNPYAVQPNTMVRQPDGKIIVSGSIQIPGFHHDYIAVRYDSNGTRDGTFGMNGIVHDTFIPGFNNMIGSSKLQSDGKLILGGSVAQAQTSMARYLTDLALGTINFTAITNQLFVYPNPIHQSAIMKYKLEEKEIISIELLDMQSRLVKQFVNNEMQQAGNHEQLIDLPSGLASGSYLIVISSPSGKMSVKIVK